jgi:hypothetical protein
LLGIVNDTIVHVNKHVLCDSLALAMIADGVNALKIGIEKWSLLCL